MTDAKDFITLYKCEERLHALIKELSEIQEVQGASVSMIVAIEGTVFALASGSLPRAVHIAALTDIINGDATNVEERNGFSGSH